MKTKRILATILALIMIGCMAVPSFATEPITVDENTGNEWTDGDYVVSSNASFGAGITINGNVTLTINEGCTLTVNGKEGEEGNNSDAESGGTGLTINENGMLTVLGSGTLKVIGGTGGSCSWDNGYSGGAGGNGIKIVSGGSLLINNGTVSITGGTGGEGLSFGNGNGGNGIEIYGSMVINNGTVEATGGENARYTISARGIVVSGGSLQINGGTVTAKGTAGIYNSKGTITIYDGSVTAEGSEGLGIGGPMTITGGTVTAHGPIGYQTTYGSLAVSGGKVSFAGDDCPLELKRELASITGGLFNVDMSSYLTGEYFCVANTDADTKTAYPYKVVSGCYLDLEEDDNTYLDTKTIEQPYTLTQNGETEYVDVTKVKLEWTLPKIAASYKVVKTWDPDNMKWVESKDTAALGEKQATFTFTNYSSVKVCAELSFKKSIGTGNSTEIVGSTVLDTVVNDDHSLKSGKVANGATFTHTYTPTASEFNSLADGNGVYGTYTATIVNVVKVTFDMQGYGNAVDAQYVGIGGEVTAPKNPAATGYIFGGWYKEEGCNTVWDFATDTVTADTTLYAKWTAQ